MGFRPEETVYRLKFSDPKMKGLVVRAYEPPMGTMLDAAQLTSVDANNLTPADVVLFTGLIETFVKSVVEWNLEDREGNPVPVTMDGIRAQGQAFCLHLIQAWTSAAGAVDANLARPSAGGSRSAALSIPMDTLSSSPVN